MTAGVTTGYECQADGSRSSCCMLRGSARLVRSLGRVSEGISVSLAPLGCVGEGPGSRSQEG